jgi:hypothetical protein
MDKHTATEQAYKRGYEDGKQDAMKWIPVTERLPEKGGRYLALTPGYLKGFDQYDAWLIYYHPESDFYDTYPQWGDIPMDDVTHWMPLPEPPKGD